MPSALLFPGQGSQEADMRAIVAAERPDLLALACELVGEDPFERLHAGTAFHQPAIYCASLARFARIAEQPDWFAGHSLGEISALAAAGALSAEDGLRLVVTRGRLMQRVAETGPEGAMLAVGMGIGPARALAAALGLTVANDNSPEQVVLSGWVGAIEHARTEVKRRGMRAFRLRIEGAFHAPELAAVQPEFRAALDAVTLHEPQRPVLSCVTACEFDDVRRRLAESLTSGVRWREVLLALRARGVERFVEVGPGQALTKLVRATLVGVDACAATLAERVDG
ncbi:MAG TPA: ACP S-malonyltransferase [Conexibacter sp.]|nr:ACP S-malonyltransferase [Conexibacter sp.]